MEKKSILLGATNIFMKHGIKSITMDEIARNLKISKRTLYELFETKSNLIKQMVKNQIKAEKEIFAHHINNSKNPIEVMINISKNIIQMYKNSHETVLVDLKKYYKESWQLIDDFHNDYIYKIVIENLELGIKNGLYRSEIQPKILAAFYTIQLRLFSVKSNFKMEKTKFDILIKQFFDYHIYGIMSSKGIKYYMNYEKK